MAENDRTFRTSTPAANRAQQKGLGVGQEESDAQAAPTRDQHATDPQRREPFGKDQAGSGEGRSFRRGGRASPVRDKADAKAAGDLGVGTPANVDVHDLGQEDRPEQDWGEAGDEEMVHSANHSRRPAKTEAERGQGRRTRQLSKDIISRRS